MELTSSRPTPDASPASSPTVSTAVHATRAGGGGGQCSNCGAHLAADQRYCVECGRRTNEARPTLMREPGQQTVRDLGAAEASAPAALRTGNSPQGTLVAGVGVLLLALGVGVLIGHNGSDSGTSKAAAAPVVVSAAPVAAAAATTPALTDAATTPDTTASTTDAAATDKAAKKAAKAAAAAAKAPAVVKPQAGKKVKVGDKGSGPGYDKKSGEFTGDFFGN